jgi:hypothetical protein
MEIEDRLRALGEVGYDVLRRMVREILARKPGAHLVEAALDTVDLELSIPLRGPDADPHRFAKELGRRLERWVDDAIERAAAFRPGHTYCHRCEAAACEHSAPPTERHVFVAYAPTGAPRWEDFAQHCLDLRHPDVDRLYDDPPAFLTLTVEGRRLREGLLDAFASPSYVLLGQLCAGLLAVPEAGASRRRTLALTFQVAASKPRHAAPRLGLNLLGIPAAGTDLPAAWAARGEPPWRRAVRWAQSALATVKLPRGIGADERQQAAWTRVEQRVDGILRGMARRLERDHRARGRRTRHADRRHESGSRPTRKAVDDARAACREHVLIDERASTTVVLGDRGRTHFFAADGRLVSSVRYSREAIERKQKLGLWRAASDAEVAALREALGRGAIAEDQNGTSVEASDSVSSSHSR